MPIHSVGMQLRVILNNAIAFAISAALATALQAQEHPAKRLSNIGSVAIEEYAKGCDEQGRLISAQEYQEAIGVLAEVRTASARLSGFWEEGFRVARSRFEQSQ